MYHNENHQKLKAVRIGGKIVSISPKYVANIHFLKLLLNFLMILFYFEGSGATATRRRRKAVESARATVTRTSPTVTATARRASALAEITREGLIANSANRGTTVTHGQYNPQLTAS